MSVANFNNNGYEEQGKRLFQLRNLIQEDNILKHLKCEDSYLERFLAAADYDFENAFERLTPSSSKDESQNQIQEFYKILLENPTWYAMESPKNKKWLVEKDISILLNKYDKEGRPLYLIKLGKMDPSIMDFIRDIVILQDIYCEGIFVDNIEASKKGLCIIIDIDNFPFKLTKWATPHNVVTGLKRIYSMPVKDFRYHIVNSSIWLNIILKCIWPFLPQHVKDQIKFHFNDYEAMHQYIDKDVLPEEYGGTQKINTVELQQALLDNDSKISNNFKINRGMYLGN